MRWIHASTALLVFGAASLAVACGDSGSTDDDEGPSCASQVIASTNCKECICEFCADEGIACAHDQTCAGCFQSGNYNPCAGQQIATDYVTCAANNCGCY